MRRSLQYVEDRMIGRLVARFGGYEARLEPAAFDRSAARDGLDEFLLDLVGQGVTLGELQRRSGLPVLEMLQRLEWLQAREDAADVPAGAEKGAEAGPSEDFESAYRQAVEAYLKGDVERAVSLFEVCERLRPGDRRVAYNLAKLRERRGG